VSHYLIGAAALLLLEVLIWAVVLAGPLHRLGFLLARLAGLSVSVRGALTAEELQDRQYVPGIHWERRWGPFHAGHWYREYAGPVVGRWVGVGLTRRFGVTIIRTVDL
jgi:hypothetical protein